jgi:hypothetical protein
VLAQQVFSVDFPKKFERPGSCMIKEMDSGGNYLRCRIIIPSGVPANLYIRSVFFTCVPQGSGPCNITQECPGGGVCNTHPNPVEPIGFNVMQPGVRAVDWWGWTNNGDDATLHFDVTIGP